MERVEDSMPYTKKKRPYEHEWELQKKRDEKPARAARERARYTMDKTGVDKNKNGKADKREGKDIDHIVPLSKGGSNTTKNLRIRSASSNRSYSRNSDHTVKVNKPKKK